MDKKTRIFRVIGILALLCIMIVSCSTTENLYMRPLYTVDKYNYEDVIHGTHFTSKLLIAKELGPMNNTVVTLGKYVDGGRAKYSIDVYFVGSDWRYMDEIILSIDGEIITLTDDGPYRVRKSGDTVTESVTSFLNKDTFIGLRYCKSLVIQYYHKPITIPQEGLEAIWNFLKE